uniref:Ribosomal protein L19 n=1 Tax=Halydictyon mirabile TaxID=189652 RepID=A0A4D6WU35_9FLOR|nr:ribosomal protein L19 [Halydictyon mirabile]
MIKKNYTQLIQKIENEFKKNNLPNIEIGDNIRIRIKVREGNKERIQISEGIIIAKHKAHLNTTINVRKIIHNIGVERIYLIHSPLILDIEVVNSAKIKRSKLYYLRGRFGKATRLKQRV